MTLANKDFFLFTSDDNDFEQPNNHQGFNPDYTAFDGAPNPNLNGGTYQSNQQMNTPRKQSKNPYRETRNLIDNMDNNDY